ncbi:hypothetical protein [Spartinivicinus poritis]|uniref:Uncharacterized protein n=1 Tax=Spartinivicinus poritis TaxID=2994640 RepID=A0ABT5UB46_9GAMM|nr:hypothetical protein [Spartinivicinus sp. A2-2]MDE1463410.1 hypothetical protein [Spartinivicinus sp. A2-2]
MENIFIEERAVSLKGNELLEVKKELVSSLSEFLSLKLEIINPKDVCSIHSTAIMTNQGCSAYELAWQGLISTTNYRSDGKLEYGAFLFPIIGNTRVSALRLDNQQQYYDYAYRYIRLKNDGNWYDIGWQVDEFEEFENWYV